MVTVGITSGKLAVISGNKVAVPYTISGANALNATQVSVLILDREYESGNSNDASIVYYGKLDTGDTLSLSGIGTFLLPSGFSVSGWDSSYYVYLLVEDANGQYETDYASVPVRILKSGVFVEAFEFISQPISQETYVGNDVTFNVEVTGNASYTYQWYCRENSSSSWATLEQGGNDTAVLSVTATDELHGYQFRCVVYDSNGRQAISDAATLTVKPKITTHPVNKNLLVGSTAKFTVAAIGRETLSYQWQFREDSSKVWADFSQNGNTTDTLFVVATAGLHGYQFRCVVTDGNGQASYSNAATLTLKPRITTQPVDKSLLVNSTAKFTVAATGKGTLKYQWQYRKNESASWASSGQQGAKTDTLLVSATAGLHGYQFRCVVTDGNGQKTYSSAATLTLKPRITTQPVDKDLLVGSTAKFMIAATGKGTLKYQWQYRKDENASWASSGQKGAKTDTLLVSATAGLHGYQFRCVVTDGNGQKTYSKAVTLTLKPRITTQPTNTSVTAGTKAEFTVVATGKSTLKYQWQFRKNSSSEWAYSAQSGNKTATLSVAATKGLNGYQFRCIVTDGNGRKSYSPTRRASSASTPACRRARRCGSARK